jgi:hypothetical protein
MVFTCILILGIIDVLLNHSLEYIMIKRSHVYIWKWVQTNAKVADHHFRIYNYLIREIFIDETLIQFDSKDYWLWI